MKKLKLKFLVPFASILVAHTAVVYAATASATVSAAAKSVTASKPNAQALQISAANIQAGKNNTAKYSDNVEIRQGTLVINADTAIQQVKKNKIIITGNPAKLVDNISADKQVTASAKTMQFDSKANKILLIGNASITKDGKTQTGKQIVYNIATHQ